MKTRTLALTAVAALALPGAAVAAKPAEPGQQGKDKAAATKGAEKSAAAKAKAEAKQKKAKGKGFALKGVGLAALPVADGALTGELTLDPTSANKHARTLLTLTKADIAGTGTEDVGVAGDKVEVEYVGLTATDALTATDTIKVVGKVARSGKGKAKMLGAVDIRKIVVTRAPAEEPAAPQS
ncbi:MAG TPA: hypothetical protein VFS00_11455 [Polyangiaceae bacterium]|nr:hypothetical protein [Polyangiaceae bacterium]